MMKNQRSPFAFEAVELFQLLTKISTSWTSWSAHTREDVLEQLAGNDQ